MELGTIEKRYKFVGDMIEQALAFMDSMNTEDKDEDNDWGGASVIRDDLSAVEMMIEAEDIFIETLSKLEGITDRCEGPMFALLYEDCVDEFVQNILLRRLNHAAKILDEWGFRTERGIKFKEDFHDKVDALIEMYQQIYDEDNYCPHGEEDFDDD